jgi:hypothetical protein
MFTGMIKPLKHKENALVPPLFNVFTKHNRSSSVHLLQHFKRHVEIKRCSRSNAHILPLGILLFNVYWYD